MTNDVLYLCNGKRCGNGHDCGECRHTLQIEYAANFQRIDCKDGAVFFEEDEPKKGEWIDNGQGCHFCPSCGYFALYQTKDTKTYFEKLSNFCPNCGLEMMEEGKEE